MNFRWRNFKEQKIKSRPARSFIPLAAVFVLVLIAIGFLIHSRSTKNSQEMNRGTVVKNSSSAQLSQPDQAQKVPETAQTTDMRKNVSELLAIVDNQNPNVALRELYNRMQTDPVVFKNCHAIAHEIGHQAYKKYNDFITALSYQDTVCSDGYLHGLIEQRFFEDPSEKNVITDMLSVCNKAGNAIGRCWHGVGHGLMYYYNNDLPKALSSCDLYSGIARGRCDEGVFMQNFLTDPDQPLLHSSKYADPKNPFYPCPQEASRFKPYCYFYAPTLYLNVHNNDYSAALAWCNTGEVAAWSACLQGVGSLAMKYNINDPNISQQACDTSRKGQEGLCIDGMVSYYLTYTGSGKKARQMCATLETKNQASCLAAVNVRQKFFAD